MVSKGKKALRGALKNLSPKNAAKVQGGLICRKAGGTQQEY